MNNWTNMYDADTRMFTPNFPPGHYCLNPDKYCYAHAYIYDKWIQDAEEGAQTYNFALINNGKIVAIGEECHYSGGVYSCCRDKNFAEQVKKHSCWELIKDYPIGTPDDWEEPIFVYCSTYDELMNKREEFKKKYIK